MLRPADLGSAEIAAWHTMQQASPELTNPFLSAEFAITVGQFRPRARVAVLTEGGEPAAFFPFERRHFGAGLPMCGWLSPCQGIVHAPGADRELDAVALLRTCRLSSWQFDNLIAGQLLPYQSGTASAPAIELAGGFGAYYAGLRARSARLCRELARKSRKLAREAGELRLDSDSSDTAILRTLMDWKSAQYQRTAHVDRFSRPWLAGLLESLLSARGEAMSGMLSVLYAGDQPVAAQFGLRSGSLLVGWFTGYDVRYGRYSPGLIHLLQMTEALASADVLTVHMGKGAARYTQALKTHDVPVAEGLVATRSVLGIARQARGASAHWAVAAVRRHPWLHQAADITLRRSGISRRAYGRI